MCVVARGHWEAFYCRRTEGVEKHFIQFRIYHLYIIIKWIYARLPVEKKIPRYIIIFFFLILNFTHRYIQGDPPSMFTLLFFYNIAVIQNMIFDIFKNTEDHIIFKLLKIFRTTLAVSRVDFCLSNENPPLIL